jgi:sec-independent protein translocase protein TatC
MALVQFPGKAQREPDDPELWESPDEEGESPGSKMSFLEHLDELRKRLIHSTIALGVAVVLALFFVNQIYAFIMGPLTAVLPQGGQLVYTEPTEGFMLHFRMALLAGVVLAAPAIMWQVWLFIAPGLYANEKKFAIPFIFLSSVGFVGGAAFSHYFVFPFMWRFLASFTDEYTTFMPRIAPAFSLYTRMLLATGLVFQLPTVVFFLAKMGVVTARFLIRNTKYAVLIIFIIAAVITPTADPTGQLLIAGPMVALYILSIGIAAVFGKRRPKED